MATLVVLSIVLSIVVALLIGGQALFLGALRGMYLLLVVAVMAGTRAEPFGGGRHVSAPTPA